LILSLLILSWALVTMMPLKDRPFDQYVTGEASAKTADFSKVMAQAAERVKSKQAPSVYVALKQIGKEQRLDLSQFFPDIKLESSLKNIEKRNDILLTYLLKQSKSPLQLGLDLKGGVAFTLESPAKAGSTTDDYQRRQKLNKAIEIIGNRINSMGVTEPVIRAVGTSRIEVQLAGLNPRDNPDVVDAVKKPAQLAFRLVMEGTGPMAEPPASVPPGYEVLAEEDDNRQSGGQAAISYYLVKRIPELTGSAVKNAIATVDQFGGYQVHLNFTSEGSKKFAEITTASVGRLLGIVLDGKLYNAPRINEPITGGAAQITGHYTAREAELLANVLNNPLDIELQVKEQYEVGPTLAKDAVSSGVRASILGTALVCAFMIVYYRVGGIVSIVTLAANLTLILGVMASIGATLTLPGVAGIVLTIGMAVDANILIFERMREEIRMGKSLVAAHDAGYDKAFITILDAHVTQLAICAIMIALGTGPIKGFGVTLAIGVFSTLFSVLVTGHVILNFLIEGGVLKKFPMMHLLSKVDIDWIKIGKPAFITSWAIVVVGLVVLFVRSDKIFGIDFTGGDQVALSYAHPVDISQVRATAARAGITDISPSYQSDLTGGSTALKVELPYGESAKLVQALQHDFPDAKFESIGVNAIGPTIGREIAGNAGLSVGLSLCAILLYIAFRFEFGFGMGAVIATVHDVLMTVGMFVVFGGQFNAPMVAAILAIIGYSVNDTVVVFDRIREELKLNPTGDLRTIVNLAITRVFSRSIMTSFTTFLAAAALFAAGGGVLRDLALTFLIGVVTGTFSSIGIAAQVFFWWHKGDRKHVEAHHDIAPKYEWAGSSRASE
jgi:SecD/SecF fusion protein